MPDALKQLLTRLVDYAGLFPPAALPMGRAVGNYARYRASANAWMLGRFVVPVARFAELEQAVAVVGAARGDAWKVSALAGGDLIADLDAIAAFKARNRGRLLVDAVEVKIPTSGGIAAAAAMIPAELETWFELPLAIDPDPLVAAIAATGQRAKMRTGGTTTDAFPSPAEISRFIGRCAARGVPFKATAGLHHPLRCVRPLTYEPDSATGTMHGFLNVFLAAALVHSGRPVEVAEAMLVEADPATLKIEADAIGWRDHRLTVAEIAAARTFAVSFGSCSFEEPVRELAELAAGKRQAER